MRGGPAVVALSVWMSLACGGPAAGPAPDAPVASPGEGGGGGRGGGGRAGKRNGGGGRGAKRGGGGGAPAPAPGGGGGVYCEAQGVYQVCVDQGDGWEQCSNQTADGGGIGSTEAEATSNAVIDCGAHMTNMIIIDNMNGHASVVQSCVPTGCK